MHATWDSFIAAPDWIIALRVRSHSHSHMIDCYDMMLITRHLSIYYHHVS